MSKEPATVRTRAPNGRTRTVTTMRLDVELLARLDVAAEDEQRTRTNMIEILLDSALRKRRPARSAPNASVFG